MKCYRRLWQHVQKLQLQNALAVANGARAQMEREALAPPVAQPPSELEQQRHFLTHSPYAPWCEHCVAFRARQDRRIRDDSSKVDATPTISFDYCYTKAAPSDVDAAQVNSTLVLVMADSSTGYLGCVPVQSKDQYQILVREILALGSFRGGVQVRQ